MSNGMSVRVAARIATFAALCGSASGQGTEQQYLSPPTGSLFQYYGSSVATQGDVLVVGAPNDGTKAHEAGKLYVYRYDGATAAWKLEQELFASDAQFGGHFGSAVALDNGAIAVAADQQSTSLGAYSGQAYVFRYDAATQLWKEEQTLLPSVGATNDTFGRSVAIHGDLVLVGSIHADTAAGHDTGAAFVFRYTGPTTKWTQEAELVDANAKPDDQCGRSVAIDATTAVVSNTFADTGGWLDAGAVSVYSVSGTSWSQTAELTNSTNNVFNDFGTAIGLSGNRIAVTAIGEDLGTTVGDVGWLHIFERNGASWLETAAFANPNPAPSSYFGMSVAIDGDVIVVGHPDNDTGGLTDAGAAWLFRHGPQSGWVFDGELVASDGAGGDNFGRAVAVSADHLVCGAPKNDTASGTDWGVVYSFAADPISLTIAPPAPTPGQALTLTAFRGAIGTPVLLTLEQIGATPVFFPLLVATFGSGDQFALTTNAPNPALGLSLGLRAWKVGATGALVRSDLAFVDL